MCTVYSDPGGKIDRSNDKPPTERYIDIMIQGATQHGVKQAYIDFLANLENQPRKRPEEFQKFDIPDGIPTWTMQEVKKGDGNDGRPMYVALNGKVMEYIWGEEKPASYYLIKNTWAGNHVELQMCKLLYEPKFGVPNKIEDFKPEHRALIEDMLVGFKNPLVEVKAVAHLKYEIDPNEKYEWYFAIASMMNRISINNREVFPVESMPGEILDYELIFFGKMGMACA